MDLELKGKRAIVTGASRGIGRAVANVLAEEGCDLVLVARTPGPLSIAAAEITKATGRSVTSIAADTGSTESVRAMVEQASEAMGGVDILVNSAAKPMGQSRPPKLGDITDDLFWDDVNVKVLGYLRCAQAVAPQMVAQGWGRIINISGLGADFNSIVHKDQVIAKLDPSLFEAQLQQAKANLSQAQAAGRRLAPPRARAAGAARR